MAFSFPLLSQAHSNPDEAKVCYTFAKNKLQKTQSCIVSTGGGAGGVYESIQMGNKKYLFEGACNLEGNCDYDLIQKPKNKPVISYLRDGTFHNKISQSQAELAQHLLYCYKTKDGTLDICSN